MHAFDGQTDGPTDRILIARLRVHSIRAYVEPVDHNKFLKVNHW